ncbi:hypothetical protein O1M54_04045 [Streptomyces diastatochromogenes]|nr:hypothetical protein [Streptomyces diastatochromogenes]
MTACVVMGVSIVVLPAAADLAWAPASCFVVGALGWLLWEARGGDGATPGGALALAALGLLILTVRVAALYPWLHVPEVPAAYLGGGLAQTGALALLTVAVAVVGRRDLVAAEPGLS